MTLRFRRSVKIMPGVRLNFNKNSTGLSFGVPGARYTMNSNGRRTFTTGIPGTGLYDVTTLSGGRRTRTSQIPTTPVRPTPPKPGLFASAREKAFYAFTLKIYDTDTPIPKQTIATDIDALKSDYPELTPALDLTYFVHTINEEKLKTKSRELGALIWTNRATYFADPIVKKYFVAIRPQAQITDGIHIDIPFNEQCFGFIWVEVLQVDNRLDEALEVLRLMQPDQFTKISLADLQISQKDFDGAIETTEDIENIDDATAMLLILRGIAFREKGLYDAALECFKRALVTKSRTEGVLHRGLFERAENYSLSGKKAAAIKDLEKILVDDPKNEDVLGKLQALQA